jgi:hypothetical protein
MKEDIIIGTLGAFNIETLKEYTHRVTSMNVDIYNSNISLIIEKGTEVNRIAITLQQAKEIGLINFDALKQFCI